MTWDQYKERWKELKSDLKEHAGIEILAVPAQQMLDTIKTRVFEHGATTDGQQMQQYSTKPSSFIRADFDNKSAFQAGRGKSMFLRGGYKELRDIQGKNTSYIDLNYTGKFKDSYKAVSSGNIVRLSVTTARGRRLRDEHERRFGPVLVASEMEREALTVAVTKSADAKTIEALTNV